MPGSSIARLTDAAALRADPRSASPRLRGTPVSSPRWRREASASTRRAARSTKRPRRRWSNWSRPLAFWPNAQARGRRRGGNCACGRARPRCALPGARHVLSAGARRRAQAQGIELHPRFCSRVNSSMGRSRHRRSDAGDRHRATRRGVREDLVQHAGGRGALGGRLILIGDKQAMKAK